MKRENLKTILLNYYVDSTSNSILRGIRKPSYEAMVNLDKKHNVPFDAWLDIKSYLKNDTKQCTDNTSANPIKKVS